FSKDMKYYVENVEREVKKILAENQCLKDENFFHISRIKRFKEEQGKDLAMFRMMCEENMKDLRNGFEAKRKI
ncbi:hypothetical protein, partial [Candidatus Cardinium sp. cBcalN1]|uniref:hypothetical protein n=1 Tax=Candidatus Cardinium sp. cBcalN1 TaxID=2699437 RepID=UPI001FB4ACC2